MANKGKVVAFLVADETDTVEYEPIVQLLRADGVECVIVGPDKDSLKTICLAGDCPIKSGVPVQTAGSFGFDALVIPGGKGVDAFLHQEVAHAFVRALEGDRKPIAALGRGVLLLVGADLVDGHHLAVNAELAKDIEPMGGIVALSPYFKEANWITARGAAETQQVAEALLSALEDVPLPAQRRTAMGFATEG